MLFNLGGLEILAIAILTLIIFGPERLPVLFRQFGNTIRKLRDYYLVLAAQVRQELEPVEEEIREIRQVANELRQDLAEIAEAIDVRALLPNLEAELNRETPPADAKAEIKPEVPAAPNVMLPAAASSDAPVDGPVTSSGLPAPSLAEAEASPTIDSVLAGFQPDASPPPAPAPVHLADDNPWLTMETPKRIKLDEDNPWAS